MIDDPHMTAREALISIVHPELGKLRMQNVAPKLSETPGVVKWVGPSLGQHNTEVLEGILGLDDDRIADLAARGVI
jgi:formyl-CoA transferase